MGIQGLLPFLSNLHRKAHLSQYKGAVVAVDTSCWLHKGAFSCAFELATGNWKSLCLLPDACFSIVLVDPLSAPNQ